MTRRPRRGPAADQGGDRRGGPAVSRLPIADYALLSDCHSAALVSRDGSIDWLCFPRFDSPSVFGRILDDAAGHWSIRPAGGSPFETTRRYVDDTLLLETTFTTADGSVTLTDALAVGRNERGHELGAGAVGTVLRRLVGVEGRDRARAGVRAAARVRARRTRALPGGGRAHRPGRGQRAAAVVTGAARARRVHRPGAVLAAGRRDARRSPCTTGRRRSRGPAPGRRRRSATDSTTPRRRGAPGRACTRATTGRGPTSSRRAAGCCTG